MTDVPPTTVLADVLAIAGRDGWLSPPLRPFAVPAEAAAPASGRAVTVLMAPGPTPGGGALEPLYDLLSGDLTGAVVVVGGVEDVTAAPWGQILSRAAAGAGAVAVVVGGAVRDKAELQGEGIPVWGVADATVGAVGAAHVVAVGVPVTIGGVTVEPDDVVVVDAGGVVRLPAAVADEVLADGRRYHDAERRVLDDLGAGIPLKESYRHKRDTVADLRARSLTKR